MYMNYVCVFLVTISQGLLSWHQKATKNWKAYGTLESSANTAVHAATQIYFDLFIFLKELLA